jgi:hypothetical protein
MISPSRKSWLTAVLALAAIALGIFFWSQREAAGRPGFFITTPGYYAFGRHGCYAKVWLDSNGKYNLQTRTRYAGSLLSRLGVRKPEIEGIQTPVAGFITPGDFWFCYPEDDGLVWVYVDGRLGKWFTAEHEEGNIGLDFSDPKQRAEVPATVLSYLADHGRLPN